MSPETEKIAVLLVFALALLAINLKAGSNWLKFVTLWPMLAMLAAAGWFTWLLVSQ